MKRKPIVVEKTMTPLEKARAVRRAAKDAGEVIERKNPVEKLRAKPKSLRLAVNAKCYDCAHFQKKEITLCPAKGCPLWAVRPYQGKKYKNEE